MSVQGDDPAGANPDVGRGKKVLDALIAVDCDNQQLLGHLIDIALLGVKNPVAALHPGRVHQLLVTHLLRLAVKFQLAAEYDERRLLAIADLTTCLLVLLARSLTGTEYPRIWASTHSVTKLIFDWMLVERVMDRAG